jgi:predicted nucleic acid-binding protein
VTDLIFDNTPLSHFARARALHVLEAITVGFRRIVPGQVVHEIVNGVTLHPALAAAINLPWVEIVELADIEDVIAFARYKAELGGGTERNNGEAAVLAWASRHGGTVVIDERAGTRAARRDHIEVHGTLWLVANALRDGKLIEAAAVRIIDQLADTDMALPTDGAGFLAWAREAGLLP